MRRWKFRIETLEAEAGFYVDEFGAPVAEEEAHAVTLDDFKAQMEAAKRADTFEARTGGLVLRVVCESHGRV